MPAHPHLKWGIAAKLKLFAVQVVNRFKQNPLAPSDNQISVTREHSSIGTMGMNS